MRTHILALLCTFALATPVRAATNELLLVPRSPGPPLQLWLVAFGGLGELNPSGVKITYDSLKKAYQVSGSGSLSFGSVRIDIDSKSVRANQKALGGGGSSYLIIRDGTVLFGKPSFEGRPRRSPPPEVKPSPERERPD